jgi:hypothetical protein
MVIDHMVIDHTAIDQEARRNLVANRTAINRAAHAPKAAPKAAMITNHAIKAVNALCAARIVTRPNLNI